MKKEPNDWDDFTFKANMVIAGLSAIALILLLIISC
jgi:hypothetical protein